MAKYLLKGGTVATSVQGSNEARVFKADVLIEGNTISRIEENIAPAAGVEVIDCRDKWITPGFVDTHRCVLIRSIFTACRSYGPRSRHVFMTVLRGTQCE